jgi:hypothetical protein
MKIPAARTGHVLALDIAGTTGWCAGAFGQRPRIGAVSLRGDSTAERMAALRQWLDDFEAVSGKVSALVVEAAIVGQHNSLATVEMLWSLRATVLLWAYDGEMAPPVSYASSTVRAHMLGTSRFPKGTAKDHVVAWCRSRGFDTASTDAADAALTWHYAEALLKGTPAAPRGQLLQGAA